MSFHYTSTLNRLGYFFQTYGVTDVLLPFLLIFTILFAVFQRIHLFGDEEKKNIHIILSLIFAIMVVVPHVTRRYPVNYDPITIINAMIPSAAVLAIIIILVLFLLGLFGSTFMKEGAHGWVIFLILLVMGYIFGATVGWWNDPSRTFGGWWDSELSTLIVVIIVFGIIIAFITGEEKKSWLSKIGEVLGNRYR